MKIEFSHYDADGSSHMVDVTGKPATHRMARAAGFLRMLPETAEAVRKLELPKGNPFEVARVAGILAAKETGRLIPLCHPLALTFVDVQLTLTAGGVEIRSEVRCKGETGVEMEALTAAAVAGLTLYDMCKAVDKSMVLEQIRLLEKQGGQSGHFLRMDSPPLPAPEK